MRKLLPIAIAALLVQSAAALGAEGPARSETVRLLVEGHSSQSERSLQSSGVAPTDWHRVELTMSGSPQRTAQALENELGVRVVVERSYPLLGPENEPSFDFQWALENEGQDGGEPDADIDARHAWSVATGAGVVVAVVDSGVQHTHPELDGQMWTNPGETINGLDDDGNGYVDDTIGWDFRTSDNDPSPDGSSTTDAHGTYIAGIIAAKVDGSGITGVAPDARIMNVRACDNGFCWSFDAAQAIYYAVDGGADIVNLSFGGPVPVEDGDPALEDAIDYARAHGVLVVTAAGNTPPDQIPPGEIIVPAELEGDNNLAVAATDRYDQLASFSYYSDAIDIAAPGVDIVTTGLSGYSEVSGTSFAAPMAAGAAALMMSADPAMGYAEVIERLIGFADKPAHVVARVGAGRLNIGQAMTHHFIDALGHLFENDIEWAADRGITKGCNPPTNTRFCPDGMVSREVMAAFLDRALDLPTAVDDYFTDDDGSIFEASINNLAAAGITRGCGVDIFCPHEVVDRGQMAAFLVRSLHLTDDGGGDLFIDDDGSIFEADIDRLGFAGITKGCNPPDNDRFCPDLAVDRGAMAAFLHRAIG